MQIPIAALRLMKPSPTELWALSFRCKRICGDVLALVKSIQTHISTMFLCLKHAAELKDEPTV